MMRDSPRDRRTNLKGALPSTEHHRRPELLPEIDLRDVTFIDSSGLGALISLRNTARECAGKPCWSG